MLDKPFIEFAYDVISSSDKSLSLKELFDKALELSELKASASEQKVKMAKLYTSLTLDGRFVLVDGKWDLSARYTFSQIHKSDVEFEDEDDEEDKEESELLRQELGEEKDDDSEQESDDLDFDKPNENADDADEEF